MEGKSGKYLEEKSIAYYQALLERYARFVAKDAVVTFEIVEQILKDYAINWLSHTLNLRLALKTEVYHYCYFRIQLQIFNGPDKGISKAQ